MISYFTIWILSYPISYFFEFFYRIRPEILINLTSSTNLRQLGPKLVRIMAFGDVFQKFVTVILVSSLGFGDASSRFILKIFPSSLISLDEAKTLGLLLAIILSEVSRLFFRYALDYFLIEILRVPYLRDLR